MCCVCLVFCSHNMRQRHCKSHNVLLFGFAWQEYIQSLEDALVEQGVDLSTLGSAFGYKQADLAA